MTFCIVIDRLSRWLHHFSAFIKFIFDLRENILRVILLGTSLVIINSLQFHAELKRYSKCFRGEIRIIELTWLKIIFFNQGFRDLIYSFLPAQVNTLFFQITVTLIRGPARGTLGFWNYWKYFVLKAKMYKKKQWFHGLGMTSLILRFLMTSVSMMMGLWTNWGMNFSLVQ